MAYKGPGKDYTLMQAAQIAAGRYQSAPQTLADQDYADLLLDTLGNLMTNPQGGVASGAADSGNPIKVGGVYRSSKPTFVDGQRGDLQLGTRGSLVVQIAGTDSTSGVGVGATNVDGTFVSSNSIVASAVAMLYNGASWDRERVPTVFKPFASTAITAGTGITLWTPAGGKKFRLMGWVISSDVAAQLIFGDNAIGTVIARTAKLVAASIAAKGKGDIGNGILSAAANNVLKLDTTATGNVAGIVWGTEE
jgi:hypothetical protein